MPFTNPRWINWRNAMFANPKFQRFVAGFPLTRPVAKHRANALFTVVTGFVYSQILTACIRIDLFEMLRAGPMSVDAIAAKADIPVDAMLVLLKGAASLNLTEELPDTRYALGTDGAALLGNPGITEMVIHHGRLYADLADPVALLRRGGGAGELASFWPYSTDNADAAGTYSALMAASQPMIAEQVLDAVPLKGITHLLDIGGGHGVFLESVHVRAPSLNLSMLDLPAVADKARDRIGGFATVHGGSFLEPLPHGADMISLVRIAHDHDDDIVMKLLRNIRAALPPGGRLLIAEPMADTPSAKAMGHGYFGMYLLAMGSGRPRTAPELHDMLAGAGFASSKERRTRTPLTCRVIVAQA